VFEDARKNYKAESVVVEQDPEEVRVQELEGLDKRVPDEDSGD
jgi:hypothetical protein